MMLLWTGSHAQEWAEKMNDPNATFKEVQTSHFTSTGKTSRIKKGTVTNSLKDGNTYGDLV